MIGTENDATDIIKGTPAYKALKDYNSQLVKEQRRRLTLIANQFGPPRPRRSKVSDDDSDDDSDATKSL